MYIISRNQIFKTLKKSVLKRKILFHKNLYTLKKLFKKLQISNTKL